MSDFEDTMAENAAGPRSASVDGQTVEQHSLADQIAYDKYRRGTAAITNPAGSIRRFRMVPPGAA